MFQSTPSDYAELVRGIESFNPRPRAGGDAGVCRWLQQLMVSIHAPARGATIAFA